MESKNKHLITLIFGRTENIIFFVVLQVKFRAFKLGKPSPKIDVFDSMFNDKTIDPITGGLLGRYIAEERDSTRLLAAEYSRLRSKEVAAKARAISK